MFKVDLISVANPLARLAFRQRTKSLTIKLWDGSPFFERELKPEELARQTERLMNVIDTVVARQEESHV